MRVSLMHDVAWAAALIIFENLGEAASPEQEFELIYARVKYALEMYETKLERIEKRLKPSSN